MNPKEMYANYLLSMPGGSSKVSEYLHQEPESIIINHISFTAGRIHFITE